MILKAKVYSEPCQTSKVTRFAKMFNDFHPLTVFAKRSILRKIAVIHFYSKGCLNKIVSSLRIYFSVYTVFI